MTDQAFKSDFLKTLQARGYIHQVTHPTELDEAAASGVVTAYIGFDATAPSLHVGSLIQIMMLRRLQQAGHKPIVLMGGGTTKVGDPTGKDASRPQLTDDLYNYDYRVPNLKAGEPMQFTVNEFEPVFDAADFVRCGRDLFVTRSNVTNLMGIEWLRRHLGPGFRIHEIESRCPQPMHIDSSFMPLAPGKVLVNPDYVDVEKLPAVLKKWDVLIAPRPDPVEGFMSKISMCSPWKVGRRLTSICWSCIRPTSAFSTPLPRNSNCPKTR